MAQEIITLYAPGFIPGIPGASYGPGVFLVDWEARTIEEVAPEEVTEEQAEVEAGTEETPAEEGA